MCHYSCLVWVSGKQCQTLNVTRLFVFKKYGVNRRFGGDLTVLRIDDHELRCTEVTVKPERDLRNGTL